jgi:hypothetical protein
MSYIIKLSGIFYMDIEGYTSPEIVLLKGVGSDAINGGRFGSMAYECVCRPADIHCT